MTVGIGDEIGRRRIGVHHDHQSLGAEAPGGIANGRFGPVGAVIADDETV
jgi:hypothetical protein